VEFWLPHAQGGCTPLYVAAQEGEMEVMRALLAGGADIDQADKVGHVWGRMRC